MLDHATAPVVPLRPVSAPPAEDAAVQAAPTALIAPVAGVYTAESRALAYDLWAWTYGRSFARTADETGVSLRTLHSWAKADRWRERHEEERSELSPEHHRYIVALGLGADAIAARDYLGAVARGDEPPNKDRQAACIAILDRAGFAPIHYSQADLNRERTRRDRDEDEVTQEQIDRMSVEELRDYSERRRAYLDQQERRSRERSA